MLIVIVDATNDVWIIGNTLGRVNLAIYRDF